MPLRIKRVYEPPHRTDGLRVLVDRLWPRGLSKDAAKIDLWVKELSPSHELRKWYGHAPERWPEFQVRYADEVTAHPEMLARLRRSARQGIVTLLFGSREEKLNNAAALKQILNGRARSKTSEHAETRLRPRRAKLNRD